MSGDATFSACTDLRETLLAGDDDKALIALITVVMHKSFTRELIEIFADAANVTIPDHPPPSG